MESKFNGSMPFLDVLISKKDDNSFSHQVFRKKSHIEQYLHVSSHHYLSQKMRVLNMLATRVLRVSDEICLDNEKTHILKVFENNGYSKHLGRKAFLKVSIGPRIRKEPRYLITTIQLPFIQGTTDKISRILKKHKVSSSFRPLNTIESSLRSVKDLVDPKSMKGVYIVSCSYGTPYIGEIG